MIYYLIEDNIFYVAITILLMRLCIASTFSLSYYGNQEYFNTDFTSTAFAVSNTTARLLTIVAPMFDEILSEPLILFTFSTFITGIASYFLVKPFTKFLGNDIENLDIPVDSSDQNSNEDTDEINISQ